MRFHIQTYLKHETLGAIFELVYLALITNLLLVISGLPLVAVLLTTDPTRSWPLIALMAPLCAPGVCAAFAVLSAFSADHAAPVVRTFATAWRACLRPATSLGSLTITALVVFGVDTRAAWGRPIGAVAIPMLITAMILTVMTSLLALVAIAERPTIRMRDALRACLYLSLRRWYLTFFSLAVLALFETLVATRPAIAFGLAAAPLLYLVWANSRYTLREVLGA